MKRDAERLLRGLDQDTQDAVGRVLEIYQIPCDDLTEGQLESILEEIQEVKDEQERLYDAD